MTEAQKQKKPRKCKPAGPFSNELLDQLLTQAPGRDAESLLGESGLIGQLKKQLAERMLSAELSHHLASEVSFITGSAPHDSAVNFLIAARIPGGCPNKPGGFGFQYWPARVNLPKLNAYRTGVVLLQTFHPA